MVTQGALGGSYQAFYVCFLIMLSLGTPGGRGAIAFGLPIFWLGCMKPTDG